MHDIIYLLGDKKMKLLIVDDEELIRNVIKEYASLEGFEIDEAYDGLNAIDMVKNNDYDLIIMDIMMPKCDGYKAVEEIKKMKNIPFIMLSARNEEYDKLIDEVCKIVEAENIESIVLGFPKNMNNTIGPKGMLSIEFKEKLEKKLNIPIYLQDERLTTKQAEDVLIANNTSRKKRKKVIDALAATIILQSFLDRSGN